MTGAGESGEASGSWRVPEIVQHLEAGLGAMEARRRGARRSTYHIVTSTPERSELGERIAVWTPDLSLTPLASPQTGRTLLQEIFTLCDEQTRLAAVSVIDAVVEGMMTMGIAVLRGQVVGPLPPAAPVHYLYATAPDTGHFGENFGTCATPYGDVAIVWLVPIGRDEARLIEQEGWQNFEDLADEQGVDLTDWGRLPITAS